MCLLLVVIHVLLLLQLSLLLVLLQCFKSLMLDLNDRILVYQLSLGFLQILLALMRDAPHTLRTLDSLSDKMYLAQRLFFARE